jgi:hypothetical protein
MPAKITFAGETTCKSYVRGSFEAYIDSRCKTYQTNAARDGSRKRGEDVHSWAQPLRQSLIATMRFVEFSNLIFKDSKDGGG